MEGNEHVSTNIMMPRWAAPVAESVVQAGLDTQYRWIVSFAPREECATYVGRSDETDELSVLEQALRLARVPYDLGVSDDGIAGERMSVLVRFDEGGRMQCLESQFGAMQGLLKQLARARKSGDEGRLREAAREVSDKVALLAAPTIWKDTSLHAAGPIEAYCVRAVVAEIERCRHEDEEFDPEGVWTERLDEGVEALLRREALRRQCDAGRGTDADPGL